MSRIAPFFAGGFGQPTPVFTSGVSPIGIPFLQDQFPQARLVVEAAWGANLTASPDSWAWTDITRDVRQADNHKISMRAGRANEATTSQPASCSMLLDNRSGRYSQGIQSANWPYVRRNTPIRVRVDIGSGPTTLFQGFADGFTPEWDVTGRDASVNLSASGVLRRLQQGDTPVVSAMRRSTLKLASAVAYWPCEDGEQASYLASGLPGKPPMVLNTGARPDFATETVFSCSAAIPNVKSSAWIGGVNAYTSATKGQVRFLAGFPSGGLAGQVVLRFYTAGSLSRWELLCDSAGSLKLNVYNTAGTLTLDTGYIGFKVGGQNMRVAVGFQQNGGNVDTQISTTRIDSGFGNFWNQTANTQTVTNITQVAICPNSDVTDLVVGHVLAQKDFTDIFQDFQDLTAYKDEAATTRVTRLCGENTLPVTVVGSSLSRMGPQSPGSLLGLLRECEVADQAILLDGVGSGVQFFGRGARENANVSLTLAASAGDVIMPFGPVDDDQRNRNKVTAKRKAGGDYTVEDVTGVLGTTAVGVYDEQVTVNAIADDTLPNYASWLVHMGTVDGYRYPTLAFGLHRDPQLAAAWLACPVGGRINLTGVSTVRTQHPTGTVELVLEGWVQEIDQKTWSVTAICSRFQPWRIAKWAAEQADTDSLVGRRDTAGSTITADVVSGVTSLTVATPSGPAWTTASDDLPFDVDLGGLQVSVSAVSGASSPQTFTVTGVSASRPAGTTVSLYQPAVVSL